MSKVRDFAEIISTGVTATDVSGLDAAIEHIAPSHIKTTLLYPAVSGNILNGTAHSGTYGDTVQTDGHKYYYTDIKGSKPIKDPRIGAHFGSQRHKFRSLQLLEQETATHGKNVFSIDGRESCRGCGELTIGNNLWGHRIYVGQGNISAEEQIFIEIVGYFNAVNVLASTANDANDFKIKIDGGSAIVNNTNITLSSGPLGGRGVDQSSVSSLDIGSVSLGLHTIKIYNGTTNDDWDVFGYELIAQDTTDNTTRNQIQIPAQTVISFNKQHSISATAQHYDPFNGFTTGDLAAVQALGIDDTTSLGLSAWWYSNSSVYYRPYNGGRVVKWIDSSGTIKTSVNMMPFNATSISNSNINKKENASATNNDHTPSFIAGAVDHSLAEVAKTFHWREFGNGAANSAGGGGTSNTYADASMLNTVDDVAYVMDDGLTSITGDNVVYSGTHGFWISGSPGYQYITFIGTGISWGSGGKGINTIVQNLPYGTHIIQIYHYDNGIGTWKVDGVTVKSDFASGAPGYIYNWGIKGDMTFHQPKMPPIPEDACIIADYMLMADFVKTSSGNQGHISKGVRYLSSSRDVFYDQTSNITSGAGWGNTITRDIVYPQGYTTQGQGTGISAGSASLEVPYFGTDVGMTGYTGRTGTTHTESINSTSVSASFINSGRESRVDVTGQTLQLNGFKSTWTTSEMFITSIELAIPIHTSSHYQTFETPFLHELIGGDRNMEQTNLVVTPDRKTWDEVTRDTSYIGNLKVVGIPDPGTSSANTADNDYIWIIDNWRGLGAGNHTAFNKDFAIAYDRMICLKEGHYEITASCYVSANSSKSCRIFLNTTEVANAVLPYGDIRYLNRISLYIKRGDYIQIKGRIYSSGSYDNYASVSITKL